MSVSRAFGYRSCHADCKEKSVMATPGHVPMKNTDRQEDGPPETAGATSRPRISLPEYRHPRRQREAFPESVADEVPIGASEPLLDVAAASFGHSAANTDTALLEAVIGTDDRVRVSKERMAMNPWRQICALRIVSQTSRTFVGTGWFIAPGVLATAGHCVFLQDEGGWAKSIRVIPAKRGVDEPFGTVTADVFASVDGWVKQRQRDFDYGVIFLNDKVVGTKVGNFAVDVLDPPELEGTDAQISGYPADRDRAEFQFFHARPMLDVTDTRLVYDIDTFGGQSGSPIWQETDARGVVAVRIDTPGGVSSNSGTRITGDIIDNLVKWIAE